MTIKPLNYHGRLLIPEGASYMREVQERAGARLSGYMPMTVADRLSAFAEMGYAPHGLYVPYDENEAAELRHRLAEIGLIVGVDERLSHYLQLQRETAQWQQDGVEGSWTGQQAWARSEARFRLIAVGRRGGKSLHASREALAVLLRRSRSRVWVAAPTMHLVARCFDMIVQLVDDLKLDVRMRRNTRDEKLLVLQNGGTVEGVSLDEMSLEAGAAVDLAIVDEAAEITQDAWLKVILPPLSDRKGQALLISTYKGQENFFYEQSELAKVSEDWDFFESPSYAVNFYAFPQGPRSLDAERAEYAAKGDTMGFLEQYGSIPGSTRRQIYPQYRDAVHAGDYPYVPGQPVHLAIDPSSGANEYAVAAIQRVGMDVYVIDEYYVPGVIVEDIVPVLNAKPWRKDVTEGICDSAMPSEIERWVRLGFNIIPVYQKPHVEDRIPIYRKLLRDPADYYPLWRQQVQIITEEWGWGDYEDLSETDQFQVNMAVEELLSEHTLTPSLLAQLQACAHIHINRATCPNLIKEHKTYAYRKPRRGDQSTPERPRKWKDHLLDGLGYYVWQYLRFDVEERERKLSYSYLKVVGRPDIEDDEVTLPKGVSAEVAGLVDAVVEPTATGFLQQMRQRYGRGTPSQYSILRAG